MSEDLKKNEEIQGSDEKEAGVEKLKKSYQSIEIPAGLRDRVLESIVQGQEEAGTKGKTEEKTEEKTEGKTGGAYMIGRILLRTGQTVAAALAAITILANSGAGVAYAMEKIPVIGAITKVVTFRTYEKQEGTSEAKIEVPKVEAENGSGMEQAAQQLNQSVEEYTNQIIARFEADVKAENGEGHKAVYSGYDVVTDNDRLFTLRINTTEVMASGAESVKLYNLDKKADKILTLKDMFTSGTDYVNLLSDAVRTIMEKEMQAGEGKTYFLNDGMDSDFKTIKENQNFYINAAGHMVLVFDEYEVAPGSMGIVEIEIPEAVFKY